MPSKDVCFVSLAVLFAVGTPVCVSANPPTHQQMFYARREVDLETELAKRKLMYTDEHPYVKTLQEEINRCRRLTTSTALQKARRDKQPSLATLEQELALKQEELYELRVRFTDAVPRVIAAKQTVDDLTREIALRKHK